jgi:tetratricopeptide (TPR) repeat protein
MGLNVMMRSNSRTRRPWGLALACFLVSPVAPLCFGQLSPIPDNLVETERSAVSGDLEMIYAKTNSAVSIADYSQIVDFCRNVAGDSRRSSEDRKYAKSLQSWALNRRGEARSDRAGEMVRSQQLQEAKEMDTLARKDFETSLELDSTRWRAYHNLAILLAVQGDTKGALSNFDQVIRLKPDFSNAYFNRGEMLFRANQAEASLKDFDKAVELSPDDAASFSGRAHALYALGRTQDALNDYAKAMELAPNSADAATEYADTCQALGKWKEAATAYQKALQLDENHAKTLQNAAWMMATCPDEYFRNGEAAVRTAQRAVQAASGPNAQVLDVLAAAQASSGDFNSALATVAEALRSTTDPSLRSELQMRAKLYQRKKAYMQSGR